jgi:LPS sulfotransferase NodH
MAIMMTDGQFTMDPDDPQWTTNNVHWGLKIRFLGALGNYVLMGAYLSGSTWQGAVIDSNLSDASITAAGGPAAYVASMVPKINDWLATMFQVSGTTPPGTAGATPLVAQVFALIQKLVLQSTTPPTLK